MRWAGVLLVAGCYGPALPHPDAVPPGDGAGDDAKPPPDGRLDGATDGATDGVPDGAPDGVPDGATPAPDAPAPDAPVALCAGDGVPCTNALGDQGTCWGGSCCTGCWNGFTCRPGDTNVECGTRGVSCFACTGFCTCDDAGCPGQLDRRDVEICSAGACVLSFFECCGPPDGVCAGSEQCLPTNCEL